MKELLDQTKKTLYKFITGNNLGCLKTSLLISLRCVHRVQKRNNEYRYVKIDYLNVSPDYLDKTSWSTNKSVIIEHRRNKILEDAQKHKKTKSYYL